MSLFSVLKGAVSVADPLDPSHVLKPNSDGSINVVAGGAGSPTAVVGNVASGAADAGAPVKVGGIYNTSPLALTNGQRGDLQVDAFGNLRVGPDGQAVSGSVSSAAVLFTTDMLGFESISLQYTSVGSGNVVTYESSEDNTNWVLSNGRVTTASAATATAITTATTAGKAPVTTESYQFPKVGRYFRARVSTYSSGTVTVVGTLSKNSVAGIVASQVFGQVAHDGAVGGNPVRAAGRGLTTNYTAVSTGDTTDLITTLVGALIQRPYSIPEADWSYAAAASGIVNTTTAVTIKAAGGAGLRNYITAVQIFADALGAATELAIRDGAGGAVLWRVKINTAGILGGISISFPTPIFGTAATLLEVVTLTASVTGAVYFNAQGYVAP